MRLTLIATIALVLAGCQTTGTDYSSSSSVMKDGVCAEMPIKSTAEVMPLRGENCIVTTPTGDFSGTRYAAKFIGRDLNWSLYASYTDTGGRTYMEALPFWDAINGMWSPVKEDARNRTGARKDQIDGLPVQTAQFEMKDGKFQCVGFLAFGNYKGAGYDKRMDGFVCSSKPQDRKWFIEAIESLNLDELLT